MGKWDDEEASDSSSAEAVAAAVAARRKFDDEEDDDDVLDSWDAAEDSEVEREKAKKAEEAKAGAAKAKPEKKPRSERVAARIAEKKALQEGDTDSGAEDLEEEGGEARRARLLREEMAADLAHAQDLFDGDVGGVPSSRKAIIKGSTVPDPANPDHLVDLAAMPLFDPKTKAQFEALREVVGPIIAANATKAHYALFLVEFAKRLAGGMPSDQIKKVASALTTLSNEKLKEEKAQLGGKKTKAAKTKTTLAIGRGPAASVDTKNYDDEDYGDEDFM